MIKRSDEKSFGYIEDNFKRKGGAKLDVRTQTFIDSSGAIMSEVISSPLVKYFVYGLFN